MTPLQLQVALKTREEEHSARLRETIHGTVRRILQVRLMSHHS